MRPKASARALAVASALLLSPALGGSGGQGSGGSVDLAEVYRVVRTAICAYMAIQGQRCTLPGEIVVPADDNLVAQRILNSRSVQITYVERRKNWVRERVVAYLRQDRPGQLTWLVPADKEKEEKAWLRRTEESLRRELNKPKDYRFKAQVRIVPVPPSDLLDTISRFPFVFTENEVFINLLGSGIWARPDGSIASTVVSVMRTLVAYLSSSQVVESQARAEEKEVQPQ